MNEKKQKPVMETCKSKHEMKEKPPTRGNEKEANVFLFFRQDRRRWLDGKFYFQNVHSSQQKVCEPKFGGTDFVERVSLLSNTSLWTWKP